MDGLTTLPVDSNLTDCHGSDIAVSIQLSLHLHIAILSHNLPVP